MSKNKASEKLIEHIIEYCELLKKNKAVQEYRAANKKN